MNKHTLSLLTLLIIVSAASGQDWPQWRGPDRNGVSTEKGLMKKWPAGGPKILWSTDGLGVGYSPVSVAGDMIYVTGIVGGEETLFAINMKGEKVWSKPYGRPTKKSYSSARTAPAIDNGLVYVISTQCNVVCMTADKGEEKWSLDCKKKYGAKDAIWGMAESPLIVDDKVICTVGGSKATMVAINKKTGTVKWTCKSLRDKGAYASPLLIKKGSRKIITTFLERNIVGIDAKNGKLLWKYPYKNKCSAHANTPVYADGYLVFTSGYDYGAVGLKLSSDGKKIRKVWSKKEFDTHHGGIILVDGHVYGTSWNGNGNGKWMCVELKTGRVKYDTHWKNKGSLVYADGMLYCYEEKGGNVALVPATPKGFNPVSTFRVSKGSKEHWAHPVVCGGRLYIRHGDVLMAYDVKAK